MPDAARQAPTRRAASPRPSGARRLRLRFIAALAGVLTAVPALALPVRADEFQPPRSGFVACYARTVNDRPESDRVLYSVVGLEGGEAIIEIVGRLEAPYRIHTYRGIHTYLFASPDVEIQETFDRHAIDSFGRLEAGKTVRVDVTRTVRREMQTEVQAGTLTLAIEGRERIAVPAGEFDAWVVLRRIETQSRQGAARYLQDRRSWYVADLGWFVRLQLLGGPSASAAARLDLLWSSDTPARGRRDLCESEFVEGEPRTTAGLPQASLPTTPVPRRQ